MTRHFRAKSTRVRDLNTSQECETGILYCRKCGGEYSADRGDYFLLSRDHTMKCCGLNLLYCKKEVLYNLVA